MNGRELVETFVDDASSAAPDPTPGSDGHIAVCEVCHGVDGDHHDGCPIPVCLRFLKETA